MPGCRRSASHGRRPGRARAAASSASSSTGAASWSASRRVLEGGPRAARDGGPRRGVARSAPSAGSSAGRSRSRGAARTRSRSTPRPTSPSAAAAVAAYLAPAAVRRHSACRSPARPASRRPPAGSCCSASARSSDLETDRHGTRRAAASLELLRRGAGPPGARREPRRGEPLPSRRAAMGRPGRRASPRRTPATRGREEVRQELRFRFAARRLSPPRRRARASTCARSPRSSPPTRLGLRIAEPRRRVPRPDRRRCRGRSPRPASARPPRRTARATLEAARAPRGAAARRPRRPAGRVSAARVVGQPARRSRSQATALLEPLLDGPPVERPGTAGDPPGGPRPRRGRGGRRGAWESTATRSRTASATSRPARGGIWTIRSSGWPCPWPSGVVQSAQANGPLTGADRRVHGR